MQKTSWFGQRAAALLLAGLFGCAAVSAQVDPPGRVGRLADLSGQVSVYDHERGEWVGAARNRPITSGDRIATAAQARAEVRIGSTVLRLAGRGELEALRIDDEKLQFQLHGGSLALRVRSREVADEVEVRTREVRLRPMRAGHYRIDRVDDITLAGTWRGDLLVDEVDGFPIGTGQRMELWRTGAGAGGLQHRWSALPVDELSDWVAREDRQEERSAATRQVSPEMTGAEDLDRHGRWDRHPEFGAIWIPLGVQVGWAPYRFGRWVSLRPWGWTWVDDAPWGFAPFHYGRWVHWQGQWCWSPGNYVPRPVFAPALVAWVGGPGVSNGGHRLPGSNWVPLAPRERFVPGFAATPRYADHFNTHPHLPGQRFAPGQSPPQGQAAPAVYTNQTAPGGTTGVSVDTRQGGVPRAPVPDAVAAPRRVEPPVAAVPRPAPHREGRGPGPAPGEQPAAPRHAAPVPPVALPAALPAPPAPVLHQAPSAAVPPAPPAAPHPPPATRVARERDVDRDAREEGRSRTPESRHGQRERENFR